MNTSTFPYVYVDTTRSRRSGSRTRLKHVKAAKKRHKHRLHWSATSVPLNAAKQNKTKRFVALGVRGTHSRGRLVSVVQGRLTRRQRLPGRHAPPDALLEAPDTSGLTRAIIDRTTTIGDGIDKGVSSAHTIAPIHTRRDGVMNGHNNKHQQQPPRDQRHIRRRNDMTATGQTTRRRRERRKTQGENVGMGCNTRCTAVTACMPGGCRQQSNRPTQFRTVAAGTSSSRSVSCTRQGPDWASHYLQQGCPTHLISSYAPTVVGLSRQLQK